MSSLQKACHFLWLVFFFLNFPTTLSSSCSHDESSALIQFKSSFSIKKTNDYSMYYCDRVGINSYPKTHSWKEGTDCCSWDGVTCDNIKGHVIGLDLSCSLLYGSIHSNSTLFHLPHLQKLNLAFNDFNASKMSFKFGEFASLVHLNLSGSNFAGHFPSQVFHLSKLVSLDLSWNNQQTFDKYSLERLVHSLTEVRQLFLDGINMSSVNPNVFMNLSSSLRSLSLNDCDLRGKFPKRIFHLPNLKTLDLGYNKNLSLSFPQFNRSIHLKLLDLSETSFSKGLPDSIGNLVSLEELDLSWANLMGSIPRSLGNLSSLRSLNLHDCGLQGKFPENIFHMPSLKMLYLGSNVNLSLPKSNRSNHLELLDLSATSFSKGLPDSIGNLVFLKELYLSSANLPGSIPKSLGNLSSLRSLYLDGCGLQGKFPENIFHMPSLKMLYLGSNVNLSLPKSNRSNHLELLDLSVMPLSKELIDSISNLAYLEHLDVSNAISSVGGLLDSIGNLISLKYLDASQAHISGAIPKALGNLSKLNYLDLRRNNLSGQIPSSLIKNLSQLEFLDLGINQLEGPIPDEVSAFPNLLYLDLYSNLLNGTLPSWLYTIPSLKSIDLSFNQFSGHIKEFQYHSLEEIILSSNKLQGPIPSSISQLLNLTSLDLSSNKLSGIVEFGMFSKLQNLKYLDLSSNSLSIIFNGTNVDHTLPNLQSLSLSSCNLREFPRFLRGSKILQSLDLSNNRIYGKIPKWMGDVGKNSLFYLNLSHNFLTDIDRKLLWNEILILDLSSNLIHGIIPTFAKGCQLRNLNLNENHLERPLTRSIRNCRSLEVLDVGNNKIKGKFPHWLGSLPQLEVLVLRSNRLQGSIHDTWSNHSFSKIQIFDLSINCFTGTLPLRYIKNFKAMVNLAKSEDAEKYLGVIDRSIGRFYRYSIGLVMKGLEMELEEIFNKLTVIDLSQNMFEGGISEVIGKLNSLKGLNLSHNNLSGCIPTSIGNLSSLEWLDLSSNKLNGTIPETLLDVKSLSTFNVSENRLEGMIPQGKQFNTFGTNSYQGNKGLCGFPVSKGCNNSELPPSILSKEDGSESNITFGWKVVLIGYGCGVVFGLAMGYVVFQTGKPKWLVALVEDRNCKRRNPSRIGNQRGGRRRI
ncbi:hypothetical protein PTKIN_Ptkin14bG0025400 [Pterospermum kingtungense]